MPHMPGFWPMMIVVVLLFVMFGANRLPEAARSLGRASTEFKKGLKEGHESEPTPPALNS